MGNIHVLPTDKPSRLCLDSKDKLLFAKYCGYTIADGKQNIYITSDEEIKEGDYIFETDTNKVNIADKDYYRNEFDFKIILTTDQDLIKDGVQAIDDIFLEWFVNNPSCEYVEVKSWKIDKEWDEIYTQFNPIYPMKTKYKIIIPKEEPEQECMITKSMQLDAEIAYKSLPKQENTIEYDLLQHIKFCLECKNESQAIRLIEKYGFEKQEQDKNKYSEEEVHKIIGSYQAHLTAFNTNFTYNKWFEQFKKK
jgi:hypothetical protein